MYIEYNINLVQFFMSMGQQQQQNMKIGEMLGNWWKLRNLLKTQFFLFLFYFIGF